VKSSTEQNPKQSYNKRNKITKDSELPGTYLSFDLKLRFAQSRFASHKGLDNADTLRAPHTMMIHIHHHGNVVYARSWNLTQKNRFWNPRTLKILVTGT
jgi:hypothetical protein